MNLSNIKKMIYENNSFIIAGHVSPDGDCIGSAVALATALLSIGKKVDIYLENFPRVFNYLNYDHKIDYVINKENSYDVFIALDCGDKTRLGEAIYYLENIENTINIDHHKSNDFYGKLNCVQENISSTCEIIYDIFMDMDWDLSKNIAEALFTGLVYDTGAFKHSNTSSKTLRVASSLLKYDINSSRIINKIFFSMSYTKTKMLGKALSNSELKFNNKMCIATIDINEFNQMGATSDDVSSVVQYLIQVEGVSVACFLYEKQKNLIKVSLRSEDEFDVSKFAQKFNGGGHAKAAGFTLMVPIEEAKIIIEKEFQKQMNVKES